MGEIVDLFENGYFCDECGTYLDGEKPGYPRCCLDCSEDPNIAEMYKDRICLTEPGWS